MTVYGKFWALRSVHCFDRWSNASHFAVTLESIAETRYLQMIALNDVKTKLYKEPRLEAVLSANMSSWLQA